MKERAAKLVLALKIQGYILLKFIRFLDIKIITKLTTREFHICIDFIDKNLFNNGQIIKLAKELHEMISYSNRRARKSVLFTKINHSIIPVSK